MPALAEKSDLVNVHEERIQRLEDGVANTRTDVALVDQRVAALDDSIKEGMKAIAEQLGEMAKAFKEHAAADAQTADKVEGIVDRITKYEEKRAARRKLWASWGKGTWAVIGGAVAVFLKETVAALWKKYTHQ